MSVLQTAGTMQLRKLPLHLHISLACESYHSHGLIATAAALGPHSSHVGSDTSGSIRLIALHPLQRDPPAPFQRGPQLSPLKGQQVDALSHPQPVYLTAMDRLLSIADRCIVGETAERNREIDGEEVEKCVNDKDKIPQKDKQ